MLFNSIDFLIFFPIVLLVYWIIPKKIRYVWIVVASYYFYMCWDTRYGSILLYITMIAYLAGLILNLVKEKNKTNKINKVIIFISAMLCFGVLFYYKYFNFMIINFNKVVSKLHFQESLPVFDIVLPVGISFYIFQAFGYIIDVYRGKVTAESNFFKFAAFVSFFPSILSGPIERGDNLLKQISSGAECSIIKVKKGLILIAWGLFLKLVLSNNLAPVINEVYDNYSSYGGIEIIIATILFGIQIYCDFAGYSYIAIGSARVMGFELLDNFKAPYFSMSTSEFWRKWHISLTSWFRDYLYIPLGGNRKGKYRKYINTMIIFGISGLWHGASWSFVFWGIINGFYLVVGQCTYKTRDQIKAKFKINKNNMVYKICACIVTFSLIDYAWMYFRADSLSQGIHMTKSIFTNLRLNYLVNGEIFRELGSPRFFIFLLCMLLLLFVVDFMQYRRIDILDRIIGLPPVLRWGIYIGLTLVIIICGVYGYSYEQTQFIYFQF